MKIIECVPNFSEGRNKAVIDKIADAISQTPGVKLLNVDPGYDTNRTVMTFVGEPDAVLEGAFQGIKTAAELIDMKNHKGEHARLGATDVCPFIPISNTLIKDCIRLSQKLGKRVAEELKIPVYLYEASASRSERINLSDIRSGEYEGLSEKIKQPEWLPDFGEPVFNAKSGATVIGARKFLIAYNINLNTSDRKLAHEIALNIREAGRAKRDGSGAIIRDENGVAVKEPGLLKNCKAVGWYIDEYKKAQVSMNLTDFDVTSVHTAFDTVVQQAEKLGLRVTGSELVGLMPLRAILECGAHYYKKQGKSAGQPEAKLIEMAIQSLGLNDISKFNPEEKIIEYLIQSPDYDILNSMPVKDFLDELSIDSPAPGGGSVAALTGALAASLGSMVSNLSVGNKKCAEHKDVLDSYAVDLQRIKKQLAEAIDKDTQAFNMIMAAMRLPKETEQQKELRNKAVQEATIKAINVPLSVAETSLDCLKILQKLPESGLSAAMSDIAVAVHCAMTAIHGAIYNIIINLPGLEDKARIQEYLEKAKSIRNNAEKIKTKTCTNIDAFLENNLNNS